MEGFLVSRSNIHPADNVTPALTAMAPFTMTSFSVVVDMLRASVRRVVALFVAVVRVVLSRGVWVTWASLEGP